jgi:hypothetical protein
MSITINTETDRLFVAICKKYGHSYVMLGTYDKDSVQHVLCKLGKYFNVDAESEVGSCFSGVIALIRALFSSTEANLLDEGISTNRHGRALALGHHPISYQAYDITYEQYLEFIQTLESLQTEKEKFVCYKPYEKNGNKVLLRPSSELLGGSKKNGDQLLAHVGHLSIGNTCRHTAIKLVEQAQNAPISESVSTCFLNELPYQTHLDFGKPSADIPFYVLPASPAAYLHFNEKHKQVLGKLYQRMETLLFIDIGSKITQNKFQSIKKLYLQLVGSQKSLSLGELLHSIVNWKQENKSILMNLRQTYLWDAFFTRNSATMQMVEELEHDLQYSNYGQKDSCTL